MPKAENSIKLLAQNRLARLALGIVALCIITGLLLWLAWPVRQTGFSGKKLHVVAAENFWGDIARQVGGQNVQVISFINDPTVDPHLYESNAANAAEVAKAQVVVVNGLGYDDFMSKLLAAASNNSRIVITAADVVNASSNANPHIWYRLSYVQSVAASLAAAYEKADFAHAAAYRSNLARFTASLDGLYKTENEIKERYGTSPVAYTERVPAYMLQDTGLTVKTPPGFAEAIENGNDPSPGDTEAMGSVIKDKQIKVLLYNAQATSAVTEAVRQQASQEGIPVIGVTETLPLGQSYQQWQQAQLDKLLTALETK